jgi:hypothetical protein
MDARRKGKWIHRNEVQWRSLLSLFSHSGLSVSAFCRREAVSTASFYRWRALIERPDRGLGRAVRSAALAVPSKSAFLDLGALQGESGRAAPVELRLDLGGGLTLHLVRR